MNEEMYDPLNSPWEIQELIEREKKEYLSGNKDIAGMIERLIFLEGVCEKLFDSSLSSWENRYGSAKMYRDFFRECHLIAFGKPESDVYSPEETDVVLETMKAGAMLRTEIREKLTYWVIDPCESEPYAVDEQEFLETRGEVCYNGSELSEDHTIMQHRLFKKVVK